MIKNWNSFIKSINEEFINDANVDYINARMQELQDVVMDEKDIDVGFEWSIDKKEQTEDSITVDKQGRLNISLSLAGDTSKYEFDMDELKLSVFFDGEEIDSHVVSDIDEGLDIIEKDIYEIFGISESFEDSELTGKRIRLIRMEDPYTKLKEGDKGTCRGVDDMGNILMNWDNGSTLSIVPEVDEYEVVNESKILGYESLPQDAIKELEMYADVSKDKVEVCPDPKVDGTFAVRVTRVGESPFHLLWNRGAFDEVDFDEFPPKSGDLKFLW